MKSSGTPAHLFSNPFAPFVPPQHEWQSRGLLAEKIEAEVQQQEEAERAAEKGKKKGKGKAAAVEEPPKKKARK